MPHTPERPTIVGTRGVLASGHYLATAAGFEIMRKGGNAIDAAAAMSFCLNLLEPHQNGFGGEVPILVYSARDHKVHAISGQGWSPEAFTIDWCRSHNIDLIPGDGFLPACVPATFGTWAIALERFGTLSFSQILKPAIELATNGFPMYRDLQNTLSKFKDIFIERYPSTAEIYLPNGEVPEIGTLIKNPDLARTLGIICNAEEAKKKDGRSVAIRAACDAFYMGEIADTIVRFISKNPVMDGSGEAHTGLLTKDDFAQWKAEIEEPVSIDYRGLDVHKCSSWTQGPVFLQQLSILEGFDLNSMGHNSPEYLHTLIEVAKLAFADREAYYGDPHFDLVPLDILLSKDYADERRASIGKEACNEFRAAGAGSSLPNFNPFDVLADNRQALGFEGDASEIERISGKPGDTTHLDAVDFEGNMVAATPSGGWIHSSPVIPGIGFPLGTRGQMFYLNPARPNALEPRKRPRTTLTPTLVTKNGEPYMAFGTRGGDSQDQWTLQLLLNFVDFGMDLQSALDSPHLEINHVPESFYPREAFPGRVSIDKRFSEEILDELKNRGHILKPTDYRLRMMGIVRDVNRGIMIGSVCSESEYGQAIGW